MNNEQQLNDLDAMISQAADDQSNAEAAQALAAANQTSTALTTGGQNYDDDDWMQQATEDATANTMARFVKLADGGVIVDEVRYTDVQIAVVVANVSKGGSFKPFIGCNSGPAGEQEYARCYSNPRNPDKLVDECTDKKAEGMPWDEYVNGRKRIYGDSVKAFTGYMFSGRVVSAKNTAGEEALDLIGTYLRYTSTPTGTPPIVKTWNRAQNAGLTNILVNLSGKEVTKTKTSAQGKTTKITYKELVFDFAGAYEPVEAIEYSESE